MSDEDKYNEYTSNYCSKKLQLEEFSYKDSQSMDSISYYIFGGFITIASIMIALVIYSFAKQREILAFNVQQVFPVAEETIKKVTPTIADAKATTAKTLAPAYGEIAKEISKGLKESLDKETTDNK